MEAIHKKFKKDFDTIVARSELFNEEYKSCVAGGGKVVSHVFCLPNSYRKDVLPPTGKNSEGQFIPLTGFLPTLR